MSNPGLRDRAKARAKHPLGGAVTGSSPVRKITGRSEHETHVNYQTHSSKPLSSLVDPDAFGPPPKHVRIHGANASPGGVPDMYRKRIAAPPSTGAADDEHDDAGAAPPPKPPRPGVSGMTGLPAVPARIPQHQPAYDEHEDEEEEEEAPPAKPPRPGAIQAAPSPPPPYVPPRRGTPNNGSGASTPRPPPRLPSRQPSHQDISRTGGGAIPLPAPTQPAAPSDEPYINTQAASRLEKAGVSVPGFNIGGSYAGVHSTSSPPPIQQQQPKPPAGQMNELQARFARMGKGGDAGSVADEPGPVKAAPSGAPESAIAAAALKKPKPKPPPPKKKPELSSAAVGGASAAQDGEHGAPPPIPHASKPR